MICTITNKQGQFIILHEDQKGLIIQDRRHSYRPVPEGKLQTLIKAFCRHGRRVFLDYPSEDELEYWKDVDGGMFNAY